MKRYSEIWEKTNNLTDNEFDSEPLYGHKDKYLKTKLKWKGDKVNTNFQGRKIPKENAWYKCLSLIMLDSAITVNKTYYPQTLLEECIYNIKKNKMENLINDDLDLSSSGKKYDSGSDNKSGNESDNEFDNWIW